MTTLRDLVPEVQEAAVLEAIARFYDQRETQWLPDAVFAELECTVGSCKPQIRTLGVER